jgi:transcription initiation factor IIE alpha subunit
MVVKEYQKGEFRRVVLKCERCRKRFSQVDALRYGGKCPRCGGTIVAFDEFWK